MRLKTFADQQWSWLHIGMAVLLASCAALVTRHAWGDIFLIASTDPEYSHIFLVPIVAAWIVFVRRHRIRFTPPRGQLLGPLIVAIGWAISHYGYLYGHQSLWHGGSVVVMVGAIVAALGKNVLLSFFPAFFLLIFMVPFPNGLRLALALPLQEYTAIVAHGLLNFIGVPTDLAGNQLFVNDQPVLIAEQCNGVRNMFSLAMVSYAFAFGMPLRNSVRIVVLLANPVVTVFCNVLRIMPTAWLFGYGKNYNLSNEFAHGFHDYSGYGMLAVTFLMLYGLIRTLKWAAVPVSRYTLASQP